jgi:hypothetical protein
LHLLLSGVISYSPSDDLFYTMASVTTCTSMTLMC